MIFELGDKVEFDDFETCGAGWGEVVYKCSPDRPYNIAVRIKESLSKGHIGLCWYFHDHKLRRRYKELAYNPAQQGDKDEDI